jgi:hypothetical protein
MDETKRKLFIADLVGYKIQRDMEMNRKLKALSGDSKTLNAILNVAKGSSTGMSLELILENIKIASSMDIFSFKINGVDFVKLAEEQMKGIKGLELEVSINPLYFASEVALRGAVMPGFRKKSVDEAYINERVHRAEQAWVFKFEKDIQEYVDKGKYVKTILEETK